MSIDKTVVTAAVLLALAGCDPEPQLTRGCEPAAGTICTVAGRGQAGLSGDDDLAWRARLYLPMDAAYRDGDLYVVDWNNHRLRLVDDVLGENLITTCAGTGVLGDGPVGPALGAAFNHPTDIVFDGSGRMLIAAWHNSRIRRIDMTTMTLSDVAGNGGRAYAGDDGPASSAILDLPAGLDTDAAGNIFFVDQANQVIRRIDAASGTITRVAGMCITDTCADGQVPTQCAAPSGRWRCGDDPSVCAMPCQPSYGGDGGLATAARLALPFGQSADPAGRLAIADDGTIYVADTRNHRIRVISPDGMIDTYAGNGTAGFAGDGGPADAAQLNNPVDVELAEDGTLYFTDVFNHCVRAISPEGVIRTAVGQCGVRGFAGDGGDPLAAELDRPYGIEIDHATGNLYVTDTHNQRIRVVMPPAGS
jgi:DNA-binding beta-propeller fold protein YncE